MEAETVPEETQKEGTENAPEQAAAVSPNQNNYLHIFSSWYKNRNWSGIGRFLKSVNRQYLPLLRNVCIISITNPYPIQFYIQLMVFLCKSGKKWELILTLKLLGPSQIVRMFTISVRKYNSGGFFFYGWRQSDAKVPMECFCYIINRCNCSLY